MDALSTALKVAASGLTAQSERQRVVSENLANAQSTGKTPGADPYTRKYVTFENELDETIGANIVKVGSVERHRSPFRLEHNPGHPAADQNGFVKMPNVEPLVETLDMREAQRAYDANLSVIETARNMDQRTLDLLKGQ